MNANKVIVRIALLMLALVLCLPLFTACGNEKGSVNETKPAITKERDPNEKLTDAELRALEKDNLPEWVSTKFSGEEITTYSFYENFEVDTNGYGELTGDKVGDLIYKRNMAVEERLDITIQNKLSDTTRFGEYAQELNVFGNSQTSEFDFIYTMGNSAIASGVEYLFFSDVSQYEYLSLEEPWWKRDAMEAQSYNGKYLLYLCGDITLTTYTKAGAFYVNSDEYAKRYEEGLDGLYDLVIAGGWTMEVLAEKAAESYSDLNGDGLDLREDFIGFAIGNPVRVKAVEYGFDVRRWSRDDNGYVIVDVDLERASKAVDAMIELLFENPGVYYEPADYLVPSVSFVNGNILFYEGQLKAISQEPMRNMEENFGILPSPKLDLSQKDYLSEIQESSTFVVIPTTCRDTEFTSIVIEALCAQSYRTVTLPFLEEALKLQYVRESRAGQVIDIILRTAVKDYFGLYNPGGMGKLISSTALMESNRLSSNYTSLFDKAETKLTEIRQTYFKDAG
ncbi:MAG: hypothetical protein E7620_00235 [Ruminococcaceae bacterium]|nr:hypothetical protein [Oscillospiraceae bacterium]